MLNIVIAVFVLCLIAYLLMVAFAGECTCGEDDCDGGCCGK